MRRFLLVLLVACGGSGSGDKPDSGNDQPDAAIDAPGTTASCSFTEAADTTNNTSNGAEATGVTFAAKTTLCGTVNNGHFDAQTGVVDIDTFKVTVAAEADLLVHLTGSLGAFQRAILQVGTSGGMLVNARVYEGDHGTLNVHLAAGEYVFAVAAVNAADSAAPTDYKVTIVADAPATRCAKVTAAASFTEANDGGANNGNDMITVDEAANPSTKLTPSNADNPEPTALTLAAGTNVRITGSSAAVNPADNYMDRDTFLFTTGATTTQLSIRLNWTSTTTDFDYKVFPPANVVSIAGGLATSNAEDEFQTFAVKPSTPYWLWVGAYDGSTGAPTAYDATLCPEAFAP